MKTTILSLLSLLAITAAAQQSPVKSDVYAVKKAVSTPEKILSGSTQFLEALEIQKVTLAPNASAEADKKHDMEELVIITSGTLSIKQNNNIQSLGPGSIALTLPGDAHSLVNKSNEPVTYYVLTYKSNGTPDQQRGQTSGGSFMVDRATLKFQEHGKGGIWRYYNRPTTMFERMEMHVTSLNQGLSSHDPHTHKADEIVLLVKGEARMHIDGQEKEVTEGAVVFLGSMVPHAITNTGTGPAEYFAFQWD